MDTPHLPKDHTKERLTRRTPRKHVAEKRASRDFSPYISDSSDCLPSRLIKKLCSRPDSGFADLTSPESTLRIKISTLEPAQIVRHTPAITISPPPPDSQDQLVEHTISRSLFVTQFINLLTGTESELMLWDEDSRTFHPRIMPNIEGDVSSPVLMSLLEKYSWHGQWMREIHDFVFAEHQLSGQDLDELCLSLTQTQRAFKSILKSIYIHFYNELTCANELFQRYFKLGSSTACDIFIILRRLSSSDCDFLLQRIEFVARIFIEVKGQTEFESDAQLRSTRLLSILFKTLVMYREPHYARNLVWSLFVSTIKPLLDFFESLLQPGSLVTDNFSEFPLLVDHLLVDNYYNQIKLEEGGGTKVKDFIDHDTTDFWLSCVRLNSQDQSDAVECDENAEGQVQFLSNLKKLLLNTARSCVMLNILQQQQNQQNDQQQQYGKNSNDKSLYETFCDNCQKLLEDYSLDDSLIISTLPPLTLKVDLLKGMDENCNEFAYLDVIMPKFEDYSEFDPIGFAVLDLSYLKRPGLLWNEVPNYPWHKLPLIQTDLNYCLPTKGFIPMNLLIERAMSAALAPHLDQLPKQVLQLVLPRYEQHLINIHDYYLMLNGQEMSLFRDKLFAQLAASGQLDIYSVDHTFGSEELGQVRSFMTFDLQAISNLGSFIHPQRTNHDQSVTLHDVLKQVHLIYNEIEWPSKLILTPKMMDHYSKAFHFLLSLTYCRWNLNQIRYSRIRGGMASRSHSLFHTLTMIKFTLDSTIATFELQLMSRIAAQRDALLERHKTVSDFGELKTAHRAFMKNIRILTSQTSSSESIKVQPILSKFMEVIAELGSLWEATTSLSEVSAGRKRMDEIERRVDKLHLETSKCVKLAQFIRSY